MESNFNKSIIIRPGKLKGKVEVIKSKSAVHRLLICKTLREMTDIYTPQSKEKEIFAPLEEAIKISEDIEATEDCLKNLKEGKQEFFPGESGSTLRFLIPVIMTLNTEANFFCKGRLAQRPLSPLKELMERRGCKFYIKENVISIKGKFHLGEMKLQGTVSSQFFSGLLFAMAFQNNKDKLYVRDKLESEPYVDMSIKALELFGIKVNKSEDKKGKFFIIENNSVWQLPETPTVPEGDWSNGAFWIAAKALGSMIEVEGLSRSSIQGDRIILDLIKLFKSSEELDINVSDCPDLVPVLAVLAAFRNCRTFFSGGKRLRFKESDRIASTVELINNLGGVGEERNEGLVVQGSCGLKGGTVDSFGDHRIAMAAAVAALGSCGPVEIINPEVVKKSYPGFFTEFEKLGGNILWKEG